MEEEMAVQDAGLNVPLMGARSASVETTVADT